MKKSILSLLLRGVVVLCGVVWLFFFYWFGKSLALCFVPEEEYVLMPNLLRFLLLIPVVPAMVDAWCILTRIGRNKTFCRENARSLKRISFYALTDTVLAVLYGLYGYFTADFDLELSGGYDWFIAFMVLVLAVSLAVTAAAAALSWLTYQAAELQDESDLTI